MPSFEEIYQQHYRMVLCLCIRVLKNREDAEDITQDIFIHLNRKLSTFKGESALSTWIYRVTINHCLMFLRRPSSRAQNVPLDTEIYRRQDRSSSPEALMTRLIVEQGLSRLAKGYRKVLVEHDLEGFEHMEISERNGFSEGTSKSQLFKGRRRLRHMISAQA